MSNLELECSFREVEEWFHLERQENSKKKCGYYSQACLPVKGYGTDVWSIVAYIQVDFEQCRAEGLTDDQILQGCLNYLNKPPTRRHRKSRYGRLLPNAHKILEEEGLISVCLLIDQRNNKNFWGKGWRRR